MKKLPKKLYAYMNHKWLVSGKEGEVVCPGKTRKVGVYELVGFAEITNEVTVKS